MFEACDAVRSHLSHSLKLSCTIWPWPRYTKTFIYALPTSRFEWLRSVCKPNYARLPFPRHNTRNYRFSQTAKNEKAFRKFVGKFASERRKEELYPITLLVVSLDGVARVLSFHAAKLSRHRIISCHLNRVAFFLNSLLCLPKICVLSLRENFYSASS